MGNYNISLVVLSYTIAVIGSLMALIVTRDALNRVSSERKGLITLASLCLGGVGIWSMHFIGMLALEMNTISMNYSWGLTALSLLVGVGVVYIGLALMSFGEFGYFKLILAGIVVGLGVAAMHYTGMLAMQMQADLQWNWNGVALSIGIAISAAIVALWLAVHVKHFWQMLVSALIMGVAVCGMHYIGMNAVSFVFNNNLPIVIPMTLSSSVFSLIISLIDAVIVVLAIIVAMVEANKRKFMLLGHTH